MDWMVEWINIWCDGIQWLCYDFCWELTKLFIATYLNVIYYGVCIGVARFSYHEGMLVIASIFAGNVLCYLGYHIFFLLLGLMRYDFRYAYY